MVLDIFKISAIGNKVNFSNIIKTAVEVAASTMLSVFTQTNSTLQPLPLQFFSCNITNAKIMLSDENYA